jgi:uncharacterized protein YkwD
VGSKLHLTRRNPRQTAEFTNSGGIFAMPKIRMIPRVFLAALALSLALAGATSFQRGAGSAEAATNCTISDSFDSQEQAFLTLINQYRAQNGRGTLTASTNLNRAAAWHAKDMATKNYFSHTDSLGRSAGTRIANCDGKPSNGENIAAGTNRDLAQEAFDAWKASSGHNTNMLNGSYKQIGIARYYDAGSQYKWYWVTDFSTTNDGTNAGGGTTSPTPTPTATKAVMTSPANGSTWPTSSVTLRWSSVSNGQYHLYVGTSRGASNLLSVSMGTATAATVSGYQTNGATVYVRLWTLVGSTWQYNDYQYLLPASGGGSGGGSSGGGGRSSGGGR